MKRRRNDDLRKDKIAAAPMESSSNLAKRVTRSSSSTNLQPIQGVSSTVYDGPLPKIARKNQSTKSEIIKNPLQKKAVPKQPTLIAPTTEISETLTRTLSLPNLTMHDFTSSADLVRNKKHNYLESAVEAARVEAAAIKARNAVPAENLIPSSRNSNATHPYFSTARGYGRVNKILTAHNPIRPTVPEAVFQHPPTTVTARSFPRPSYTTAAATAMASARGFAHSSASTATAAQGLLARPSTLTRAFTQKPKHPSTSRQFLHPSTLTTCESAAARGYAHPSTSAAAVSGFNLDELPEATAARDVARPPASTATAMMGGFNLGDRPGSTTARNVAHPPASAAATAAGGLARSHLPAAA